MAQYDSIKVLYTSLPSFTPFIPITWLPHVAFLLLALTFALTFYFSTLSKSSVPIRETIVASVASILGGFGVIALFCSVGVYI